MISDTTPVWQLLAGLGMGLFILVFHRRIAEAMARRERSLDELLRSRGIRLFPPPSDAVFRNIYFGLGVFVCLFELARLWLRYR